MRQISSCGHILFSPHSIFFNVLNKQQTFQNRVVTHFRGRSPASGKQSLDLAMLGCIQKLPLDGACCWGVGGVLWQYPSSLWLNPRGPSLVYRPLSSGIMKREPSLHPFWIPSSQNSARRVEAIHVSWRINSALLHPHPLVWVSLQEHPHSIRDGSLLAKGHFGNVFLVKHNSGRDIWMEFIFSSPGFENLF